MTDVAHRDPVLVVSSHTEPAMTAPVNQARYCAHHGYAYLFDATPYANATSYDQKLHAIIQNLRRAEWLVWLDDDVYLMDHGTKLESFFPSDPQVHFVVCDGKVNAPVEWAGRWAGAWTVFNAGAMLIRNSKESFEALQVALDVPMQEVRDWWDDERHGFYTNGDQDKLLYAFYKTGLMPDGVSILSHKAFNARIFHFDKEADQHFAVHLCGQSDKTVGINALRNKFGLDKHLLPLSMAADAVPFERSYFAGRKPIEPPRKPNLARRIARKLKRILGF